MTNPNLLAKFTLGKKKDPYTKKQRKILSRTQHEEDSKPPIVVQPDCSVCGKLLVDHPNYPRTSYPVFGRDCPYRHVH